MSSMKCSALPGRSAAIIGREMCYMFKTWFQRPVLIYHAAFVGGAPVAETILVIVGDGGESYETWFAVHRFQEAGYQTRVAAPSKKRLNLVMHDFEPGWDTYMERPGYSISSDLTFDEVVVAEYVAVLCIGGGAPAYLRNAERGLRNLH